MIVEEIIAEEAVSRAATFYRQAESDTRAEQIFKDGGDEKGAQFYAALSE